MNQLNNDQHHNSTTPSNNLFDIQKYPISPMMNSSFSNPREDSMRNNFELWKMEMDRKVRFLISNVVQVPHENAIQQVAISEKQRDDALSSVKVLNEKVEKMKIYNFKSEDLRGMPIQKLKTLQVHEAL